MDPVQFNKTNLAGWGQSEFHLCIPPQGSVYHTYYRPLVTIHSLCSSSLHSIQTSYTQLSRSFTSGLFCTVEGGRSTIPYMHYLWKVVTPNLSLVSSLHWPNLCPKVSTMYAVVDVDGSKPLSWWAICTWPIQTLKSQPLPRVNFIVPSIAFGRA